MTSWSTCLVPQLRNKKEIWKKRSTLSITARIKTVHQIMDFLAPFLGSKRKKSFWKKIAIKNTPRLDEVFIARWREKKNARQSYTAN